MKCIRCGHDSRYKDRKTNDRPNRTCPNCKGLFAFEPQQGAKLTDQAFQHAINRVSGDGKLRWGAEHLYYEIASRLRPRVWLRTRGSRVFGTILAAGLGIMAYQVDPMAGLVALAGGGGLVVHQTHRARATTIGLEEWQFRAMWDAWQRVHGTPTGLIQRPTAAVERRPSRALSYEMVDYSFDRAVICDRPRTVDLLLANNFHFENNCAVLTADGYPPGPFETIRIMLKRNPRLQVFALHDATPDGCTLAHRLATDPAWFAGQVPVTDVGLRPGQAGPFRGLWLPAAVPFVPLGGGITPTEAEWLGKYALELAAIRPDQVLKRLFRAMNRQPDDDGLVYVEGDGVGSYVIEDQQSFSADAGADDGGADSFG